MSDTLSEWVQKACEQAKEIGSLRAQLSACQRELDGLYSHLAEADFGFGGWYSSLGSLKRLLEKGDHDAAKKLVGALIKDGCQIDHDRVRDKRLLEWEQRAESAEQQLQQMREALNAFLTQIENTPLHYYGDHTGHEAQFTAEQLRQLRALLREGVVDALV